MQAEIITIGDEILIGQIIDTNSAWMAQQLNSIGVAVKQITSVSDHRDHIIAALNEARLRADIILITGGLGPTKDDLTKNTLCEYFNTTLAFDPVAFEDVKRLFEKRGIFTISDVNKKQAELPSNCVPLYNHIGTAPGMWFEDKGKIFVSMPGVPFEMKELMLHDVLPRIRKSFKLPFIIHKTILTQGVGESFLAERIASWEESLPSHIKLAYLPSAGMVRLRLSGKGWDEDCLSKEIQEQVVALEKIIGDCIYGYDEDTLEVVLGRLLKAKKMTLSTAESCTGGYIAHLITSVPGSSSYFEGSIVSYSNNCKHELLGVSEQTLAYHGAVSEEVVIEMVKGARKNLQTDCAIACSGIAGPDGGTEEKPVGLVYIAISTPWKTEAKKFLFGTDRMRNIQRTANTALNWLINELKQE